MVYKTLQVNDKELKLRISARNAVALEKAIGENPLNVIKSFGEEHIPSVEFIVQVLHASLQQLEHGYTLDACYELYDELIEQGKTILDMILLIIDIFKVSGFIPNVDENTNPIESKK